MTVAVVIDLAAERAASLERQRPAYEAARARVREILAREEESGLDMERRCKTCHVIFLQKRTPGRPAIYCKAHRPHQERQR